MSSYLGVDETGHKDEGKLHWSWCFQNPQYCVFHINPSRGSQVLKAVLGEMFKGTFGSDYYSAYHKYRKDCGVLIQYGMAHLIREIRFLAEHSNITLSRWGQKLLERMKKMFENLHKRATLSSLGIGDMLSAAGHTHLRFADTP
jgi:transposase